MTLTKTQEYWADIAYRFIEAGHKVNRIGDGSRHPYLKGGLQVKGRFSLGTLVSDNFFECRHEELGEPESEQLGGLVSKLLGEETMKELPEYDTVVLTEEPSLSIDAVEFFEDGQSLDRILLLDVDYLMGVSCPAKDIKTVTARLAEERRNPERYLDAKYRDGQQMIYAIIDEFINNNTLYGRIERICYESIPDLKQKENRFREFEIRLLRYMGFDPEGGAPVSQALHSAFSDVVEPGSARNFDGLSYYFYGKHKLFTDHVIGQEIIKSFPVVNFEYPEGEDVKTEYDKKMHWRIPGVLYAVAGNEFGQETKGLYVEVTEAGLNDLQKAEILDHAIDIYRNLGFGKAYFHRRNRRYPYSLVGQDMEWVIAMLDHTRLRADKILHGTVAEEERKLPVYGEEMDEDDYPVIEGYEMRPVKFFLDGNCRKFDFFDLTWFEMDEVEVGTPMRALLWYNQDAGVGFEAAAPFRVGD
ncbi:MAG: hypothetical protein KJ709_07495 [Nanoarchaeota archaeon]|nr:hypothetical protein [Nanoarchaeota archaeon]